VLLQLYGGAYDTLGNKPTLPPATPTTPGYWLSDSLGNRDLRDTFVCPRHSCGLAGTSSRCNISDPQHELGTFLDSVDIESVSFSSRISTHDKNAELKK
jgi:hypothetical protein